MVCVAASSALAAQATVIYDPQGFESPLFSLGDMNGQDGWVRTSLGSSTAEIVASTHPQGGDQMVRMTTPDFGQYIDVNRQFNQALGSNDVMSIQLDMRLDESWFAGVDSDAQYLSAIAMDFVSTDGVFNMNFGAIVSGEDAPLIGGKQGYVLYDVDNFLEQELDDQWHRIGVTYDNATGTFAGSVDGSVILTKSFSPGHMTSFSVLAFGSARYFGGEDTASVEFDELSMTVTPSAVPEPASLITLSLGALALARRKLRR